MKISGNNDAAIPLIQQYQREESIRQAAKSSKSVPVETVGLSNEAKEAYAIREMAQSISDVRADKIKELKGFIEAGTYNVSGEKIAGKIMEEALYDIIA